MKNEDLLIFFQSFTSSISPRLQRIANELPLQICYLGFERYQGGIVIGGKDEITFAKLTLKLKEYQDQLNMEFKESKPIFMNVTES